MIRWLYRYIFRGLGILMLIGMITILILALSSGTRRASDSHVATPSATR
jgi:hypothetical protein